jgi:molybdopterin-guanine dinucleotide biosynthesis protein A
MLQWTAEAVAELSDDVVVVRRADQELPPPPSAVMWREVIDRRIGAGPLAGIEAALHEIRHDLMVTVACDMPLVRPSLVRAIAAECAGFDVTMPVLKGVAQPLLAAYRPNCLPVVERLLSEGEGRIRALLPEVPSRRLGELELEVHDAGLLSFTNVNYPEDVERVAAILRRGHGGD